MWSKIKATVFAALAFLGTVLFYWVRRDAQKDVEAEHKLGDFQNAEGIEERHDDRMRDAKWLRKFDDAGYRD